VKAEELAARLKVDGVSDSLERELAEYFRSNPTHVAALDLLCSVLEAHALEDFIAKAEQYIADAGLPLNRKLILLYRLAKLNTVFQKGICQALEQALTDSSFPAAFVAVGPYLPTVFVSDLGNRWLEDHPDHPNADLIKQAISIHGVDD
jgi:hypothetical protein